MSRETVQRTTFTATRRVMDLHVPPSHHRSTDPDVIDPPTNILKFVPTMRGTTFQREPRDGRPVPRPRHRAGPPRETSADATLVAKRRTHAVKRERPGRVAGALNLNRSARKFRTRRSEACLSWEACPERSHGPIGAGPQSQLHVATSPSSSHEYDTIGSPGAHAVVAAETHSRKVGWQPVTATAPLSV